MPPEVLPAAWALRGQLFADDLSPGAESPQFGIRNMARQWGHAAIGAGANIISIDELQRLAQGIGDLLGAFDPVGGHVDGADHHLLATDQLDQLHRDMRISAFQRHHADIRFLDLRGSVAQIA